MNDELIENNGLQMKGHLKDVGGSEEEKDCEENLKDCKSRRTNGGF